MIKGLYKASSQINNDRQIVVNSEVTHKNLGRPFAVLNDCGFHNRNNSLPVKSTFFFFFLKRTFGVEENNVMRVHEVERSIAK
jgi:hypothetical protein